MSTSNLDKESQAALIRGLIGDRGWTEIYAPLLSSRIEVTQDQSFLTPEERLPEFKTWSHDRFSGLLLGLKWALKILPTALQKYDDEVRASLDPKVDEEAEVSGNPYEAEVPDTDGATA
jgi:hypothetical protein